MVYTEFIPGDALKPFVKCYYLFESDSNGLYEDKAFATGCMEIMFNLGPGRWQTSTHDEFITTPSIELWGQIIQPLRFRPLGKNIMIGVRFYPHTASIFLQDDIQLFNDQVTDFTAVAGNVAYRLHQRLLDIPSTCRRIELIETFLLQRLSKLEKKPEKVSLVNKVMQELKKEDFYTHIDTVASGYGISSRYLQKIFVQHTGLTPKQYTRINRFQKSLQLVAKKNLSLTSIAYECGYFDQSHFIREFKAFTGTLPSAYNPENSSAILISPN